MAQYAVAAKVVSAVVGTGLAVKSSVDQRKAQKDAKKNQREILAEQKKEQARNAIAQREQRDEINKEKAGNQQSVLGAMFQQTLSGSRVGVTDKMGGGR